MSLSRSRPHAGAFHTSPDVGGRASKGDRRIRALITGVANRDKTPEDLAALNRARYDVAAQHAAAAAPHVARAIGGRPPAPRPPEAACDEPREGCYCRTCRPPETHGGTIADARTLVDDAPESPVPGEHRMPPEVAREIMQADQRAYLRTLGRKRWGVAY